MHICTFHACNAPLFQNVTSFVIRFCLTQERGSPVIRGKEDESVIVEAIEFECRHDFSNSPVEVGQRVAERSAQGRVGELF